MSTRWRAASSSRRVDGSIPDRGREDGSALGTAGAPGHRSASVSLSARRAPDRLVGLAIVVFTLVAAGISLAQLARPGVLFGISPYDFDTGSYFGAAVLLVHGHLPYRSFVLMHPPGMTLVLSPVALLSDVIGTRDGIAICRFLMVLFVAADVFLVGRLVRHRGLLVVLIACGLLALQPDVFSNVTSVELEPLLVLFCLLGATFVFRHGTMTEGRTMLIGGVFFGLAGAVKVWAILPVLVVAALSLSKVRRRLAPFVAGVAGAFLVPSLPFMALAPSAFFHDVVTAQIGRFGTHRTPLDSRLVSILGVRDLGALTSLVIPLAVVLVLVVMAGVVLRRPLPSSFDWFAIASAAVIGISFLVPEQYFSHYAVFFAPFGAITVAITADRILGPRLVRGGVFLAWGLVAALAIAALAFVPASYWYSSRVATIDAHIPAGSCVVTDNTALTLAAGRFVSTRSDCPTIADPFGTSVVDGTGLPLADGGAVPRRLDRLWLSAVEHADYVVLTRHWQFRIPATARITSYLAQHFQLSTYGKGISRIQVYTRQYR